MQEQAVVEDLVVVGELCAQVQVGVEEMIARGALAWVALVAVPQNLLGAAVMKDVRTRQCLQRVILQPVRFAAQTTIQSQRMLNLRC